MKYLLIIVSLLLISTTAISQSVKEIIVSHYNRDNELISKKASYYDIDGLLMTEVENSFVFDESKTITHFLYDSIGNLKKETVKSQKAYQDSSMDKQWSESKTLTEKDYYYDKNNQISTIKQFSKECNFDTCNTVHYLYEGVSIKREYITNVCNMEYLSRIVDYTYDNKDSLVLEKAVFMNDTADVIYSVQYSYDNDKNEMIRENYAQYYDSIYLSEKTVSTIEYLDEKNIKRISFVKSGTEVDYNIDNSNERGKYLDNTFINYNTLEKKEFEYDQKNRITQINFYDNLDTLDLKLVWYLKFEYKYY